MHHFSPTGDVSPNSPPAAEEGSHPTPTPTAGAGNGVVETQPSLGKTKAAVEQQPSDAPVGSSEPEPMVVDTQDVPEKKKKKKKTLKWNKDADLVQTRWFLKVGASRVDVLPVFKRLIKV